MEDMEQSPLVSSSSESPPRPQPPFKYQFVQDSEDEEDEEPEDEEDEEPEEEDEDLEELEDKITDLKLSESFGCDETLFALPAASEPVIHSSAGKFFLLAFILSASFKEHEYLGNLPAVLPTKGTLQETSDEASKEFSEQAKNPFVDRDLTEVSELEYSEMGSSFIVSPKAESAVTVADLREEIIVKNKDEEEDLVSNNILRNQQESPVTLTQLIKEENTVMSPEETKDSFKEKGLIAGAPMREEYADFKPFERVWEVKDIYKQGSDVLATAGSTESKLESKVDKKCFADSTEQTNHERDSESSNDDISFPSTPEAIKVGSGAYITCTPFNPKATEGISTNVFPLLEDHTSENKTDEKKIEEKKAQIVTEKNTSITSSNPFLVATQDSETGYVKTDNLSKMTEKVVANMPEGLTPDLVQEACGSELNETIGTKIAFETKMDLVQTSEAVQESLYPVAQLCPSFEESEATPSPVLPDIVMEAPLNSVVPSAGASAVQPSSSPLEAPLSVNYESMKLEPENPPPYEEAMNVSLKKVSGTKEEIKEPESINVAVQETEAPYISIACDLIKETKLSTEPTPDFSNYSEIAKVAQPAPDHSELVEDSSPDSEPVDLFSDDSIPEVPQKQDKAMIFVKENFVETSSELMTEHENKEKLGASPPPKAGKPYLESLQPSSDTTKDTLSPGEVSALTPREKMPLQMEELNTAIYSSDGLLIAKEAKIRDSETFSDSSPIEIIDEFPTFVSSKTDSSKYTREYTDLEVSHKREIANVQDGAGSLPCSELPQDLIFKNVQHKGEDKAHVPDEISKDRSDISKMPLLPPDASALAAQTEIGSIVKPKVLVKEAEKKLPSGTEKENRSPSAIFSAELSKTSVVDLLYWRDIKKTGVVFVFSIVSVTAYIALALLSVTISFRIYKGVIQAIQKSDEGHPFRAYLESEVAISEELVQKYSNSALGHVNCTIKELRRLFLVDDLVDSLKGNIIFLQFAVLMWVFTYVGALFNGLTLLILALISLFSVPVIYERHQAQIDHYLGLANKNVKDAMANFGDPRVWEQSHPFSTRLCSLQRWGRSPAASGEEMPCHCLRRCWLGAAAATKRLLPFTDTATQIH
ncbi:Reticulon-4 [Pteropus alecto]|uniref:Reticulon n=1 Tax=Pteropus alecto TaxID=9402 RepID=L5KTF4_PTEAL|nr:Reticulon-4 [Pteropus alecto]